MLFIVDELWIISISIISSPLIGQFSGLYVRPEKFGFDLWISYMGRGAAIPEIWHKIISGIPPPPSPPATSSKILLEMSEILQNLSKILENSQKISFFM